MRGKALFEGESTTIQPPQAPEASALHAQPSLGIEVWTTWVTRDSSSRTAVLKTYRYSPEKAETPFGRVYVPEPTLAAYSRDTKSR